MKKIILTIIFLLFTQTTLSASIFDDLKENKKTSYLDFILLKIEQRLIQRHGLLGAQFMALRIQYESVGSQVDFLEEDNVLSNFVDFVDILCLYVFINFSLDDSNKFSVLYVSII